MKKPTSLFLLSSQKAFKNGEWNHYRISAMGDTIKTWVNDTPTATLMDSLDSNGFIGTRATATVLYKSGSGIFELNKNNIANQTQT